MGIENPVHLLFLAAVALVVLGPKRLPEIARAAGKGMREFRESLNGESIDEQPPGAAAVQPVAVQQAVLPSAAAPSAAAQLPTAAQPPQHQPPAELTPDALSPGQQSASPSQSQPD